MFAHAKRGLPRSLAAGALFGTLIGALAPAALAETLRVGSNTSEIGTLDPHRASSTGDKSVVGWMFNGLVRFAPGSADPGLIEADLAESWTVSEDGKEWVFKLRPGVKFHGDNGELSADDVVYSLERARDKDRSAFAAAYQAFVAIEAVDPLTVRIQLSTPVPGFLGLVANYHAGNIVSRKAAEAAGADFGKHPIGTGPFAYAGSVTQQNVTLVRHDGYFRGAPKLDGIDYRLIPADASRELAFTAGELDLIYGKREQRWIDRWAKEANVVVDTFAPAEFRTLHLNMSQAPLDDIRVREAVARAINTDQIVAFVGADVAPKGCSVVPSGYLGEDCSSWTYSHDPARAKELLAEAGHPNGITLKQVVSSNNAQLPIMEVIQAQLAEAGITLEMQVVDHTTYHDLIRKNLSAMVFYGSARFPIADSYLTEYYHSDAIVGKPTAITNFSHCAVADAEIEAARAAVAVEDQLSHWAAAQKLIHSEICAVPLFNLRQVWLRNEKLDYGYPELTGAMNLAPMITEATTITR